MDAAEQEARQETWDRVLLGFDVADEDPLAVEAVLLEADRETARLVLRGFDEADELLARWQSVVDHHEGGSAFPPDRVLAALGPYLAQVRRLATEAGHRPLAEAARLDRVRFDDEVGFEPTDLHLDWLELVDDVVDPWRPSGWRELEYSALRLAVHPVAYLDELLYYVLRPLEPVDRFDPDLFHAVWLLNATVAIDVDEVRVNRRVGPG